MPISLPALAPTAISFARLLASTGAAMVEVGGNLDLHCIVQQSSSATADLWAPVTPATLTLTIEDPIGGVATYTLNSGLTIVDVGSFFVAYTVSQRGHYRATWASNSPSGITSSEWDVIPTVLSGVF